MTTVNEAAAHPPVGIRAHVPTIPPMTLLTFDRPFGLTLGCLLPTGASALFVVLLAVDLVGRFG